MRRSRGQKLKTDTHNQLFTNKSLYFYDVPRPLSKKKKKWGEHYLNGWFCSKELETQIGARHSGAKGKGLIDPRLWEALHLCRTPPSGVL